MADQHIYSCACPSVSTEMHTFTADVRLSAVSEPECIVTRTMFGVDTPSHLPPKNSGLYWVNLHKTQPKTRPKL